MTLLTSLEAHLLAPCASLRVGRLLEVAELRKVEVAAVAGAEAEHRMAAAAVVGAHKEMECRNMTVAGAAEVVSSEAGLMKVAA